MNLIRSVLGATSVAAGVTALVLVATPTTAAAGTSPATATGVLTSSAGLLRPAMAPDPHCPDAPDGDVGVGDEGLFVAEVQCELNAAISPNTYPRIAVDGDFGPATRAKVIRFQQCANAKGAGLAVDGRVGSRTHPHLHWWAISSNYYIC